MNGLLCKRGVAVAVALPPPPGTRISGLSRACRRETKISRCLLFFMPFLEIIFLECFQAPGNSNVDSTSIFVSPSSSMPNDHLPFLIFYSFLEPDLPYSCRVSGLL